MMDYLPMKLRDSIVIKDIVTVHYFEFSKDYEFSGESHDFWELVYVDRGKIYAYYEKDRVLLKTGDIIFHKPGEWHNLKADGKNISNIAIVSFISNSRAMSFFEKKVMKVGSRQRELISGIIRESGALFKTSLGDPFTKFFERRENVPFGAEQIIRQYLGELLISIVRADVNNIATTMTQNTASNLVNDILDYMAEHVSEKITLSQLARHTNTGKAFIESSFKSTLGTGAIDWFIRIKTDYAKKYIRESNYNMSQIAEILGYDSVHYFSRQFKKVTGMSPTEYSKSIKAINKIGGMENVEFNSDAENGED
ncbi:MAG: AraC family transcriptional regulator [Clostridiales bacterium]|nr:AraC family transcriptional regulator [Clostridiales bacterium]